MRTTHCVLQMEPHHWGLKRFLNVAAASQRAMETMSFGVCLMSLFLIFHSEFSWPSVVTTLALLPQFYKTFHAGSNSYIAPSNSHKYRRCLTVHQYILHSRESITSDCVKVVRRETEIQI